MLEWKTKGAEAQILSPIFFFGGGGGPSVGGGVYTQATIFAFSLF